ncbi:MAG: fasciclin domain-containing protein [Bacteroidia bacterium]
MKITSFPKLSIVTLSLFILLVGSSCEEEPNIEPEVSHLVVQLEELGFTRFVDALEAADLVDTLTSIESLTILGPSNYALDNYLSSWVFWGYEDFDEIPQNELRKMLYYHLIPGIVKGDEFVFGNSFETLDRSGPHGESLSIHVDSILAMSLNRQSGIADYDIETNNGVVHRLSNMLKRPDLSDFLRLYALRSSFSTAVSLAHLVGTLKGEKPITIFVPTEEAIEQFLEIRNVNGLYQLTREELAELIGRHIVDGNTREAALKKLVGSGNTELATHNANSSISLSLKNGHIMLDSTAQLLWTDHQASNGVMHFIDKVLVP